MSEQTEAEIALDKFMSSPTELNDPYWKLFEVKNLVNDALVEAVKYGYTKGYEDALKERKQ